MLTGLYKNSRNTDVMTHAIPHQSESVYTHPVWDAIKHDARKKNARLVFSEASDIRILSAAQMLANEQLARVYLIGDIPEIKRHADRHGISLKKLTVINPEKSSDRHDIAQALCTKMHAKGLSYEQAEAITRTPLGFSMGLLTIDKADAAVAGAVTTTAQTVRTAMQFLKTGQGKKIVTGLFIVETPYARHYGDKGGFIFADCGVIPDPSPRMLSRIAGAAADAFIRIFKEKPRVAFLSFSTCGSAEHETVHAINQAVALCKKQFPDIDVFGETQLDAAIDPAVAKQKGLNEPSAGHANVLIFPDLNAGNITYKAVQRLGGARTIGPILWGLEKPVSDLSRGCSAEDIVFSACTICSMV
ncbi:MAG: phosphotransacetylase [Elusimicrobia bacterium]|nr:phosphotransacetylase [Elusimicrobiota bacterium]